MENKPFSLEHLVGERITAFIPMFRPVNMDSVSVILRGVEAGGVWIEVDHQVLSALRKSDGATLFVTWAQIVYIAPLQPAPATGVTH